MVFHKRALLAVILLLLYSPFVFAVPRLAINQLALSPTMVREGESLDSVSIQLHNTGSDPCNPGLAEIIFVDSDNALVNGIEPLTKDFSVLANEWKTIVFSASDPSPPDTVSLSPGVFGAVATVSCDGSVHDKKTVFFSVSPKTGFDIPETGEAAMLSLLTIVVLLLFNSKK